MACETLIFRKHFTHHGKIRLIYSVAGHAYGPAHGARLVQLTVGPARSKHRGSIENSQGFCWPGYACGGMWSMLSGLMGSWSRSTKPSYSNDWTRYMILERLTGGYEVGDISAL